MIQIRHGQERGNVRWGWLDAKHSFSFGSYYDPAHMQFSDLRVLNEDKIGAQKGFSTHPHDNMEIITYILDGELAHKDSTGHSSVLREGDVQLMSAGKGVFHSEFNASSEKTLHLLQIWIEPNVLDSLPSYQEKNFAKKGFLNDWTLLVSEEGKDGSLRIQQNVLLYRGMFSKGSQILYDIPVHQSVYLQIAKGSCVWNEQILEAGSALIFVDESKVELVASENTELLLFELRKG